MPAFVCVAELLCVRHHKLQRDAPATPAGHKTGIYCFFLFPESPGAIHLTKAMLCFDQVRTVASALFVAVDTWSGVVTSLTFYSTGHYVFGGIALTVVALSAAFSGWVCVVSASFGGRESALARGARGSRLWASVPRMLWQSRNSPNIEMRRVLHGRATTEITEATEPPIFALLPILFHFI